VLLVCSDSGGSGPLGEVTGCRQSFGCALVLAPQAGPASVARLTLSTLRASGTATPLPAPLDAWRDANASASALALLQLLARGHGRCQLPAAAALGLDLGVEAVA